MDLFSGLKSSIKHSASTSMTILGLRSESSSSVVVSCLDAKAFGKAQVQRKSGKKMDDIEDMMGDEELSRGAIEGATRAPMVAPKTVVSGSGGSNAATAPTDVPGTQTIW